MEALKSFAPLLGRFLIVAVFLVSGMYKLGNFEQTAAVMANQNLPMADTLLVLSIFIELGGALMILFGWHARLGAFGLLLWLIPVTLTFHAFWQVPPEQMQMQMNAFMKNVAIMGALILIMLHGAGRFSVDCMARRMRAQA
ncbi:DoxX family protein [Thermithiobacillus plumbiphilus]|uniref:DoxX family protein n=1 Tax=Thermithiobacillus plumbiphilus TaxID=1729899 RepID=A0ABU9DD45_9PROT